MKSEMIKLLFNFNIFSSFYIYIRIKIKRKKSGFLVSLSSIFYIFDKNIYIYNMNLIALYIKIKLYKAAAKKT
jgi:hypothetical protein